MTGRAERDAARSEQESTLFVELLAAVAWADNRLSPSEFDWLKVYATARTQLSDAQVDAILDQPPELESLLERVAAMPRAGVIALMFEVYQLLMADGRAKPEEIVVVDRLATLAGVTADQLRDVHEWLRLMHQGTRLGAQLFGTSEMAAVMRGLFWGATTTD